MYEEFTNLFGDLDKRIEDGNIIIEGDVNINIIENPNSQPGPQVKGKKSVKTLRNSVQVKKWSENVRKRDQVCQCCGAEVSKKKFQAHHIAPISKYPDLAAEEGNGIGLCDKCHSKYHQMYAGSEDPATFAKFMKDYGTRRY